MTFMEQRIQDMLFKVIERHFDYVKAAKSEKQTVKEAAETMLSINIWEMWALTQE